MLYISINNEDLSVHSCTSRCFGFFVADQIITLLW